MQEAAAKQLVAQQQAAESSLKASQDLLISNQIAKGFEQLANEKSITMRLGGIYALEGVMNTFGQYRVPVLEALSSFVRDGTRNQKPEGRPGIDIQAVITVIGRRKDANSGRS